MLQWPTANARLSPLNALVALAGISEVTYLLVVFVGQSLHVEVAGKHSLLIVLALFAIAFACYLFAIKTALLARQDRRLLGVVAIAAVMFRVTLLFSDPIEEIDLYRYLWDGQATLAGVSPFRYSPRQVLALEGTGNLPVDLERLAALRDASPVLTGILNRIHFGELPTIYPPTSQAVFALAALCTPQNASLVTRMTIMRAWFVAFDLATILLVVQLLRWVEKPIGWAIAYAWCPLLIKEVANSGHLDALAVFLTTLALYIAIRALFPRTATDAVVSEPSSQHAAFAMAAAACVLALAIGAKLYPVVLTPLVVLTTVRRLGWRPAIGMVGCGALATAAILWPMVPRDKIAELQPVRVISDIEDLPPLPPPDLGVDPRDPSQSLRAFLSEWEMNDFLFLLVMENVRPTDRLPVDQVAWFSVVPETWRYSLCTTAARLFGVEEGRAPFFFSRALTMLLYGGLSLWFAWKGAASSEASDFLEAAFLTVAWFWLLLPTQNPWYWTWALPLLPFARGRAWIALSGLALLYYVRFWFAHHFESARVPGTPYRGPQFFDYIVTWLEFGPWFAWLAFDALRRQSRRIPELESIPATQVGDITPCQSNKS